jgi:hypothetical protein
MKIKKKKKNMNFQIKLINLENILVKIFFKKKFYFIKFYFFKLDNRFNNSWSLKLNEINVTELIETQMINIISPTIIISKLFDVMKTDENDGEYSYIENVNFFYFFFFKFFNN